MSKHTRRMIAGTVAMVISAITGAAFFLGLVVGAGFGLLLVTAAFSLLAGFIAHVEYGGYAE